MRIDLSTFNGIAPAVVPHKLADGMAQLSMNTRFARPYLEGYKQLTDTGVSVPAATKSLFRYTPTHWFTSTDERVRFADATLVSDPYEYALVADVAYPKITRNTFAINVPPYPTITYRLGVPQGRLGATQPSISRIDPEVAPDPDVEVEFFTAYRISFVNGFGFEGALSEPSRQIGYYEGFDKVTVPLPTTFGGTGHYTTGAKVRIYRLNSLGTDYQFVGEAPLGTLEFVDTVTTAGLGMVAETADWFPPPDDDISINPAGPLRNLTAMPGGFFVGSTGDELCASVPGAPYAWPYRIPLGYKITGIAATGNAVVVTTEGPVFVAQGVDPSALQPTRINSNQSCVSPRSVVNVGDAVIFACPDGLVGVTGYNAELVTNHLVTKEEWKSIFRPSEVHAYHYEGKYIFFNSTSGYVFDLQNGGRLSQLDFVATAGYVDYVTDELYLMVGGKLQIFDNGQTRMPFEWRSKVYRLKDPMNFAVLRVDASGYPITVNIEAVLVDGNARTITRTVNDRKPVYLPDGYTYTELAVHIVSDKSIHSISLANSMSEILND
jgi:hypothetical protein